MRKNQPKQDCKSCRGLPEGEVIKGHDHRSKPTPKREQKRNPIRKLMKGKSSAGKLKHLGMRSRVKNELERRRATIKAQQEHAAKEVTAKK